jgi:putative lipoprotein
MRIHRVLAASALGLFMSGASRAAARSQDDAMAQPRITGTVTYRERIALPPDASVQVRLDDVSQPEASPKRVAETTMPTAGKQAPIAFELPYRAADIVAGRRYVVRAKIIAGDKTLFSTKTPYPVITRGAPTKLEILVQQAGSRPGRPKPAPTGEGLTGVEWKLVALGTAPALAPPQGQTAHLTLDPAKKTVAGSTGCNRFAGSFALVDGALHLNPGAMTMMACQDEAMHQEQAFVEALKATTGYRLTDGSLELLDAEGRVLARFATVAADPAARSH